MEMQKETVLEVSGLTVHYTSDGVVSEAVTDVSFTLERGETLGLVGETGAGKTTTALACLRLIPTPPGRIISGTVKVCGKDIYEMNKRELQSVRGKDISMIFQDPLSVLNPVHTVGKQLMESIQLHEHCSKKVARQKAEDLLAMVGIDPGRINDYPHQFSGGMKQRVVIAIALSCNPGVLIADEPTTALDVTIQAQVLDMMRELRDNKGTAMVMITHDLGIIADICNKVAVMYAGRIVESGNLEDIFDNTMHPYTEGLFNSLPNIMQREERLKPISGLMPDPTNLPAGCAFAPRCKYACDRCHQEKPTLKAVSDSHSCACLRYDEPDFHIERRRPE